MYRILAICLAAGLALTGSLSSGSLQAQATKPIEKAPPRSPAEEAGELHAQVLADLKEGRTPQDTVVARMLALYCNAEPLGDCHEAQGFYCREIVVPGVKAALARADGGNSLQEQFTRREAILRQQGVPDNIVTAQRVYLAWFHYQRQDLKLVVATLEEISESTADQRIWPWLRGMYWNLRGLLAGEESNYAFALDCHSRALELRKEARLFEDQAESLNNLGYVMFRMGDHVAAKTALENACRIYADLRQGEEGSLSIVEFRARMNRAKTREAAGDFEAALEEYQALIAAAQQSDPSQRAALELEFRNNAAVTHFSLGNFAACERELTTCGTLAEPLYDAKSVRMAELGINRGWAALAMGNREAAVERLAAAVKCLRENHSHHHRYAEGLGYLARAKAAVNAPEEARQLLEESLRLQEEQLQKTLASALSERDRLAYVQQLRVHPDSMSWPGALDSFLELASALGISDADQYLRVLKWKGVLARHDAGSQRAGDESRVLESERAVIRMRLLGLAAAARRGDAEAQSEVARLERESNDLERKLRAMRSGQQLQPTLTTAAVASAIPTGAALIDFIEVRRYQARNEGDRVGNERVYIAFLVSPGGEVRRIDLGRSALIDSQVMLLRQRLESRGAYEGAAGQLARVVGNPLRQALGDVKQVIISADGAIQHLPWAALRASNNKFWVEELTISTVPSAAALIGRPGRDDEAASKQWLAVGGVEYGLGSGDKQKWVALPKTQGEAELVSRMLGQALGVVNSTRTADASTVLTGKAATKQRVKELLPARRFVHLATHGEFQQRRTESFGVHDALAALDSVLVLAGANSDPTGGAQSLLTAEELAGMDLSQVDLAVLSACQTGLGHVQAGQGQVGLVSALSKAGVSAVIASLWKVDDEATSRLMEGFYRQALKSSDRPSVSIALRQAQMELLKGNQHQHPYYWAAWGVTGRPNQGF